MDLADFERLRTPAGQTVLAAAGALQPSDETFLTHLTRLAKQTDAALAKAALETVLLRARARVKFTRADQMYFLRAALKRPPASASPRIAPAGWRPMRAWPISAAGCAGTPSA